MSFDYFLYLDLGCYVLHSERVFTVRTHNIWNYGKLKIRVISLVIFDGSQNIFWYFQIYDLEPTSKRRRTQEWLHQMALHDHPHMGWDPTGSLDLENRKRPGQEQRLWSGNVPRMDASTTWHTWSTVPPSRGNRRWTPKTVQDQENAWRISEK